MFYFLIIIFFFSQILSFILFNKTNSFIYIINEMETDIEISENIIKEKNVKIIVTEKNSKYYIEKLHFLNPNVKIFYKFNLINNININTIENSEIIKIIQKYQEISFTSIYIKRTNNFNKRTFCFTMIFFFFSIKYLSTFTIYFFFWTN